MAGHAGPQAREPRRITSTDVAEASGVSRTTVSYVLNDTKGTSISASTRALVLATATRLGYIPSAAARTLRTGRSDVVLVIMRRRVTSAVTEAFLDQLDHLLDAAGLTMLVHHGGAPGQLAGVWRAVTPRAVVSAVPFTAAERRELTQIGVTAVTTGESTSEGSSDAALQEQIGRLQVDHLVGSGRQRIGIVTSNDRGLREFAVPRYEGARRRCLELGLPEPPSVAVELDLEVVRSVLATWRRGPSPVTGVVAYNDDMALAVLGAARAEAIEVPDVLGVIGADDSVAGRLGFPGLTTVVQAVELEARYVASRVLDESADVQRPSLESFLKVVVRGSA